MPPRRFRRSGVPAEGIVRGRAGGSGRPRQGPLEEDEVYLDRGRRTTQLMRDSLGLTQTLAQHGVLPKIPFVTPKTLFEQIQQLPIEERLKLVEDIWDGIAATPESVPIPDWHRAELDRRLADPTPERLTWEQVQERLRKAD